MQELKEFRPELFEVVTTGELSFDEEYGILQLFVKFEVEDEDDDEQGVYLDYVPDALRNRIIEYGHWSDNRNHTGRDATYNWISNRYWWPQMRKHIEEYIQSCDLCQRTKGGIDNTRGKLAALISDKPREWVFIDFAGPYLFDLYICVLVDHFSGYTLLIPIESNDAVAALKVIINEWVTIFGWFKYLSSDRGSAFINEIFQRLMKLRNVKHNLAQARNHRSIGKVNGH